MYDALVNTNVQEYAKATTIFDITRFLWLSLQTLKTGDPLLDEFFHNFNLFSNGIAEYITAYPALRSLLGELAKVKKAHKFPKNLN